MAKARSIWERRVLILEGYQELDADTCEDELEEARVALARCGRSCRLIMAQIAELDAEAEPSAIPVAQPRSLMDQVWSAIQRWWRD